MTSASELFIARRAARGARLSDPDPDPDPHPVALRDQHGLGGRRQRRGCRPRRQLDAAGDVRQHLHTGAPPPRRRGSYTDQILSYIDNNNFGDSASRRNRLDRLMFRTNERLPGAVLQAQARVLERLRGISLGSSASRPSISLDEFSANDVFRIIDFRNRETWHEANRPHSSSFHLGSESDEERPNVSSVNSNRSTGLSKAAFLRLQIEIFEASKDDNREASPECSICLDGFYDGDELIRLHCGHRFHSTCLEPWVRKCSDCPYCRTNIRSQS
ncbi:putative E3 ubiquitin-protein ligase RHY1A [Zea mays]|uniref:Putative E3 ubiquitin-protein ligase RHY1A n=1 Tax=Zea mays TaxID=4577 RepID=K7VKQ6_MAIZE|nr:putative E3 ubiquitin-protein ligase RHY1A [Zea mays]|eukprot:XP_020399094.1 putative RING zinc finger domain superfamily protein isoform X1 [Zea mays]